MYHNTMSYVGTNVRYRYGFDRWTSHYLLACIDTPIPLPTVG